jgi:hypothetical protein
MFEERFSQNEATFLNFLSKLKYITFIDKIKSIKLLLQRALSFYIIEVAKCYEPMRLQRYKYNKKLIQSSIIYDFNFC